jgi:hypothetical protein
MLNCPIFKEINMQNELIQQIVDVVNDAINSDSSAMRALFENRVPCNQRLADHPTIQVSKENEDVGYTVGLLGLLSGIAGTRQYKDNANFSRIWAVYNVDCPIHGTDEERHDLKVGDTCPTEGCDEKLILGELLRIEQVPEEEADSAAG